MTERRGPISEETRTERIWNPGVRSQKAVPAALGAKSSKHSARGRVTFQLLTPDFEVLISIL